MYYHTKKKIEWRRVTKKYVKNIERAETASEIILAQNTDLDLQMDKVARLMAKCRVGRTQELLEGVMDLMTAKIYDAQKQLDESDHPEYRPYTGQASQASL